MHQTHRFLGQVWSWASCDPQFLRCPTKCLPCDEILFYGAMCWCPTALAFSFILIFRSNTIPVLSDILSDTVKEKVSRIILATFRVSHFNNGYIGSVMS